jgi:hypothetical protein
VICLSNGTNVILGFVGEFGSMLHDYKRESSHILILWPQTKWGKHLLIIVHREREKIQGIVIEKEDKDVRVI